MINMRLHMRCARCRKDITGSYVQALGKNWHATCFTCTRCKQEIGNTPFAAHKGQPYHADCLAKAQGLTCAACKNTLTGKYLTVRGAHYHPSCFVCTACGQGIGGEGFLEKDGAPYHSHCYHERFSQRCDVCQQPMTGAAYKNAWGDVFCTHHRDQLPDCCSCQRPVCDAITNGGSQYQDGRIICNLCQPTAVMDEARAAAILQEVRLSMAKYGFDLGNHETPLQLIDGKTIKKLSGAGTRERPILGLARNERLEDHKGRILKRRCEKILILYGLPEAHFRQVAAHELCHAWLHYKRFDGLPKKVEEGLCTLSEYLYLKNSPDPDREVRISMLDRNKDPIYGDGYRSARKAMKSKGLNGMLKHIYKTRRFPGGVLGWLLG